MPSPKISNKQVPLPAVKETKVRSVSRRIVEGVHALVTIIQLKAWPKEQDSGARAHRRDIPMPHFQQKGGQEQNKQLKSVQAMAAPDKVELYVNYKYACTFQVPQRESIPNI